MNDRSEIVINKIRAASDFLLSAINVKPLIGIISGTGLESLCDIFEHPVSISVRQIPYFPSAGPSDRSIISGKTGKHDLLLLNKRLHCYEGFSMSEVAFVVQMFKMIGIKILIVTNAAGGLNPLFTTGEIMLITDHINLMIQSPLTGDNIDALGPRFPDMTAPYDPSLCRLFEEASQRLQIPIQKGVYVGVTGPNLETRAETRFLRMIGADAVGMSTIPEVIAAVHCGIRVLGISILSNINLPDTPKVHTLEEIIGVVRRASPFLLGILKEFFATLEMGY